MKSVLTPTLTPVLRPPNYLSEPRSSSSLEWKKQLRKEKKLRSKMSKHDRNKVSSHFSGRKLRTRFSHGGFVYSLLCGTRKSTWDSSIFIALFLFSFLIARTYLQLFYWALNSTATFKIWQKFLAWRIQVSVCQVSRQENSLTTLPEFQLARHLYSHVRLVPIIVSSFSPRKKIWWQNMCQGSPRPLHNSLKS